MSDQAAPKKMVIGWFSFTGCEGCTIHLSELLNKNFDAWTKLVEIRYCKTLKTKNSMEGLDVAFIEGALSAQEHFDRIQKIRDNCKYLVAVGSCAVTGRPSASRNDFGPDKIDARIKDYYERFNYAPKVKKIDEVVKVDDYVPGCPMLAVNFTDALTKYLKIFNLV